MPRPGEYKASPQEVTMRHIIIMRAAALAGLSSLTFGTAACVGPAAHEGAERQELSTGYSSEPAYLVPLAPGVTFKALLSVGDSPAGGGYPMVGIPDGLGAFAPSGGGRQFTMLANHELTATSGVVRDHGAKGAFVSKWKIDRSTLQVLSGDDLIQNIALWNTTTGIYDAPATGVALGRLCSADLAPINALYDDKTGLGFDGRLFFNGEEIGFGRAFAHDIETGISYELPLLGKLSFENVVARPSSGPFTVVAATDDSSPGEVVIYVGVKTACTNPVDSAGLTNGTLYGIKVDGFPTEPAAGIPSGTTVSAYHYGDVSKLSGAELQALSTSNGVTGFNRPEDVAWNPVDNNQLFFVTTASFTGSTRLWRVTFADARLPDGGAKIDLLVDGATTSVGGVTPKMFDNITVTNDGRYVYLLEDPGNQPHLAKVWRFNLATNALELLAQFDPDRFSATGTHFITEDEESSGIIDASAILGPGKFLLDAQVHKAHPDSALVEYGQFLLMTVTN
jgi:hypothetical protein